MLFFIFTEAS